MTSVSASVEVAVPPERAFEAFADEIDSWYRVDRYTVADVTRTVAIRFEPRVGGRLLDVHDAATGEGRELGRVTAWEPGRRLAFTDNRDTHVEVTFVPTGYGTRVTIEHSGLERLLDDVADHVRRHGWILLASWYRDFCLPQKENLA